MSEDRYDVIEVTDAFLAREEFLPYVANGFIGSSMLACWYPLSGTWEVSRYSLLEALGQNALRIRSTRAVQWFESYMADHPERTTFVFYQPEVIGWLTKFADKQAYSVPGQQ
jgi:hypothetical protein